MESIAKRRRSEAEFPLQITPLNAAIGFGALLEPPATHSSTWTPAALLANQALPELCMQAWRDAKGLLVIRGLEGLTPEQLVTVSSWFGHVDPELDDSKKQFQVAVGIPVMRIGNTRDKTGAVTALFLQSEVLPASGAPQYRLKDRRPTWHTDGTYRTHPPIGSVLFCQQAPPEGGATCWADMCSAYEALDEQTQAMLSSLECICSLAHHDAKLHASSPEYPTLSEAGRAAHPPVRVPVVLQHPRTGRPALYGINSSTCAVVAKGTQISQDRMEAYELEAVEDCSVQEHLRNLLPFLTDERFVVKWQWRSGDLVVWDNRCTIHCPTGFNTDMYTREMWRTTLAADRPISNNG